MRISKEVVLVTGSCGQIGKALISCITGEHRLEWSEITRVHPAHNN